MIRGWRPIDCRRRRRYFLFGLVLAVLTPPAALDAAGAKTDQAVLFAAASTSDAIAETISLFARQGGGRVVSSFAASSVLARQIANGARADLFLSANTAWMDELAARGLIVAGSRVDLLGNRLALIAPAGGARRRALAPGVISGGTINARLGRGRLAIADPDHVPAGIYGKAALTALGQWPRIAGRLAPAGDVRGALTFVARGEAPLGIVYASDARRSPKVRVLGLFPVDSHPAITYPLARIKGRANSVAARFHAFLRDGDAAAVFARHGFVVR